MGRELTVEHSEWLEAERKIPCEIAARYGVVSHGRHLAFEYRQNGKKVSFLKVRREILTPEGESTKTFHIEPKGAALCLWNEADLSEPSSPDAPLIITEGEFDALSFLAAGATHVVSVPNGAAGQPSKAVFVEDDKQFAYLWDGNQLKPGLQRFTKIILATDDDKPGVILRDELARRLGRTRCWWVNYPPGCKDANAVLREHGAEGLMDMIADARPIVASRLVRFSDIPEQANRTAYSSGWGEMDKHFKIVPPELCVITGVPNAGKSEFARVLGANLAFVHNLKGAILQFEDSVERNRKDLNRYYRKRVPGSTHAEASAWMDRMFLAISPNEDRADNVDFDLAWLNGAIEEAATRHGVKWILIDPWNEIEHCWKINETETAYTNAALRDLKRMTRRYQLALIVVTHPSKTGGQQKSLDDMTMYDVAGSAAWKNKCDHGLIVYRASPNDSITHIKVDKSKDFSVMGTPGVVRLQYDWHRATYVLSAVGFDAARSATRGN
jgi:twinkle protein